MWETLRDILSIFCTVLFLEKFKIARQKQWQHLWKWLISQKFLTAIFLTLQWGTCSHECQSVRYLNSFKFNTVWIRTNVIVCWTRLQQSHPQVCTKRYKKMHWKGERKFTVISYILYFSREDRIWWNYWTDLCLGDSW